MKKCFITSLFCEDSKMIDLPGTFEKIPGYDYFLFTNIKTPINTSWEIKQVKTHENLSMIVNSRFPKFQGWKFLPGYDIIIYCDAYLSPKPDRNLWDSLVQETVDSPNGVLQSRHPVRNCAYQECKVCAYYRKDSKSSLEKTIRFFQEEKLPQNFGLWENIAFCYYTKNEKALKLFDELWKFYSRQEYTFRDQPIYSYIVYKTGITPSTTTKPGNSKQGYLRTLFLNTGKMGNHTYA